MKAKKFQNFETRRTLQPFFLVGLFRARVWLGCHDMWGAAEKIVLTFKTLGAYGEALLRILNLTTKLGVLRRYM